MSERLNDVEIIFDDVLQTLRFRSSIFFHAELAAPWGVAFPEIGLPRFHVALKAGFYAGITDKNDSTISVKPQSIVMFPNGEAHWIADAPERELMTSNHTQSCALKMLELQQGPATHRLMCGIVRYEQKVRHPIFDTLPPMLYFPELEEDDPIWKLAILLDAEMQQTNDQGNAIVNRLTEALFIKLVIRYINTNEQNHGFLGGLCDRRVHQALKLIHQNPETNWTLSSLSQSVGMSRATLNRHFQNVIGVPPMTYITEWRMAKAYNLIKNTDTHMEQIAESVGFISARTLSKAFQRQYHCTPFELRTRSKTAEP